MDKKTRETMLVNLSTVIFNDVLHMVNVMQLIFK